MHVTYSFDPNSPRTWSASRWLVRVADLEGQEPNQDMDLPEQRRLSIETGRRARTATS